MYIYIYSIHENAIYICIYLNIYNIVGAKIGP